MIKINGIVDEDGVCYFRSSISEDFHNQLIPFLERLKFSEEMILKADTYFPNLNETYIYLRKDTFKIHLFVTKSFIHMVIDCPLKKKELYSLMKKDFVFPK